MCQHIMLQWFGIGFIKEVWNFPNGTKVHAHSYDEAVFSILNYDRNSFKCLDNLDGTWDVWVNRNINIQVSASETSQAKDRAWWVLYLDKRELSERG